MSRLAGDDVVTLLESEKDGRTRQLLLLANIGAPPSRVWDALTDVERYPDFMPTVRLAERVGAPGPISQYRWSLDLPILRFNGTRIIRGRKPFWVEVRGLSGDFHEARERWELFETQQGTLLAFYRVADVRNGGVLLRTAVKLEPSMDQAMNVAAAFLFFRDLKAHLEGRPRAKKARASPPQRFEKLDASARAQLGGLLAFGQVAVIGSHPDGALKQVCVLASVKASAANVRSVLEAPDRWPEFIPNLRSHVVHPDGPGRFLIDYELELPLTRVSGRNRMSINKDVIEMRAVSGDVRNTRWMWSSLPQTDTTSILVHYAYADVREASWVSRRLVSMQPEFEHGIVTAASTIAARAMKLRAEGRR